MKVNKNILICALLVLMLLLCINAASAEDTLDTNLMAEDSGEIAVDEASSDVLSASGDRITVDANGGGDYRNISSAVSAATGGETIFIKNGEYTETSKIDIGAKQLTFTGESQDGVIIKSGNNDLFYTTTSGYSSLVISGVTFKDISMTGAKIPIFVGGDGNVSITNCTFDNCSSRYGAIRIFTSGSVTIDNCKLLDTKSSTGSYSSAIDFGGSSTSDYTVKNTVIDGSSISSASTASYIFGAIYSEKTAGTVILDNVTICNCNLEKSSGLITAKGNMNIKRSKFVNNYVYRDLAIAGFIFVNGAKTVTIESTMIANNTNPNYFLTANSASASFDLNYNNIQNNTFKTAFTNPDNGVYTLNANYWGSNTLPENITATTWVVEDNGVYKLNNGDALEKEIPGLTPEETPVSEDIIYVSTTGNDTNDGLTEATAVATLAHAIEIATEKVVILNGTYDSPQIEITKNVTIETIGEVILKAQDATKKAFWIKSGDVKISDLTFTNFNATYTGSVIRVAGGSLTCDGVNFTKNGGEFRDSIIYVRNADLTLTNCIFEGNTAHKTSTNYGIVNVGTGTLYVEDCQFINNFNKYGALYLSTSIAEVYDTVFIGNNATSSSGGTGAGIYVSGSGTYVSSYSGNLVNGAASYVLLQGCSFINNTAFGAKYYAGQGGAIYVNNNVTMYINDCLFENNTCTDNTGDDFKAAQGGAIYASAGKVIIDGSVFKNNAATNGSEIYMRYYNSHLHPEEVNWLDISNSVILNDGVAIVADGTNGTYIANDNWWGTNDEPSDKVVNVTVGTWAKFNATMTPNPIRDGQQATITATFDNDKLPDDVIDVAFTSTSGNLDEVDNAVDGKASATYTIVAADENITVAAGSAVVNIPILRPYSGIIYVNATGSDDNEGSIDAPVATVGKAIELALLGSHEIVINEGTYVGNGYHVTDNLTVTGAGKVTLDANNEGRLFYMSYGDDAGKIELSNLILTNANGYGAAVYSFANELILDNVTIVNTQADGYLIKSNGKLTIEDSNITRSMSGNVIQQDASGDILINNTVFEDNSIVDSTSVMAVININSGSGNLVIEDSVFINNTARQGVIKGNFNYNIDVKGSEFIDNTNTASYGGAIYAYGNKLDVTDSIFKNNKAARSGGAIYTGYRTTATVDKSIFINNTANTMNDDDYYGDAIYNGNKLTVNNSILLGDAKNYMIYTEGEDQVIAQNNWWGTNDNPKDLVASGEYYDYDEDEDVPCPEVDVSNWVTMNATLSPADVQVYSDVVVTATFSNPNIPDGIPVTFTSTSGLNTVVPTVAGEASVTYTVDENDTAINATADNAVIEMPINVNSDNIVTNDTFYNFFDEDGFLLDSVKFDELFFKGDFSDLAAGYVILNKPVTITGVNAVLNDMGFVITSENVTLDKLTLVANSSLGNLIDVGASNVDLTNLYISYNVGNESGSAINVNGEDTITDVNILNNTIYFESHTETDEYLVTAINLDDVEDIIVDGNDIAANIPSLYVETYDYTYFMMGLCYVNPIRIYEADTVGLTNNNVDVTVNSYDASYPTVQALYIVGSEDILIKGNNITMRDALTPNGTAIYLYAVECGFSEGIEFIENNFDISTTGGKTGAGSAYALQVATSEATFIGNNITCDSNGPNLGIYSPMGFGPAKNLTVIENFINITGYAAGTSTYALVSGIEVQTGYATIYNNTIYVQNKATYSDKYPVAGVSAVQSSAKTLSFDIQDNEIRTNGKYAVDIRYAPTEGIVTGNYLLSNEFQGDKAVYFKSGNNNIVENNTPTNVVTNDTFYNFFDDEGVLLSPNIFKELIFNGTFSDLTDMIVINAPISIVGENATLNDIAIKIISSDVKVSDLTLNSNNKEFADNMGALIYATGSDIEISDVIVNYTAPSDVEAIGIYANAADNFKLTNSEIAYVGTNPGSKHNYGLEVRDSENVLIKNNTIDAILPAVDVDYGAMGSIDSDLVLAVGIQGGKDINFTENTVNVNTNGGLGYYPTIDAVMIYSADNVLVNLNNITHIDLTTSDYARYYYSVDIYDSNATVDSNNILVNTTSGIKRTGAAYPIQLTGPFTVTVSNNNLTSISRGPNAGIYASNWAGYGDLTVTDNIIDIVGSVAADEYAIVSGIESEIDVTRVYNNIITVDNLADYDDTNPVYGVSMASTWYSGDPSADIRGNNITVDGKYAVYYGYANNTNVTLNELLAHELEGNDAANILSGQNNYIDINFPPYLPNIIIEAEDIWIGNDNTIYVTVVGATGNVTIKVNEKEFKDLPLVNGTVSQFVNATDLVAGINNVTVTFVSTSDSIRPGSENSTFYVLDGVVTQDTYMRYFNQEDNGKLFDCVPDGATLDFQGSIINPDQALTVQMNVNKPVNIISTTKDAYVDLNTTAGSLLGESPGNSFAVTRGGSGSNVTGIFFHNTQIWISNTTNVVLDNISVVVEDQRVGSGVGATSIRDNSSNVILKNSYLYTRNNGGSTTFTMSWTTNCTIDNCTVKAEGNVGNLIYLNVYNIVGAPSGVPLNNYNKVINNRIYGKEGSGISVGLMVEGQYNLIENNTLYKSSISTSFGGQKPNNNTYVGNIATEGGNLAAQAGSIVYNNNVTGTLTAGKGSVVYNNTVGKSMTVTAGDANVKTTAYNNTVGTYMSVAADTVAYENVVGTYMSVAARAVAYDNTVGTYMTVAADAVAYDNTIGTYVNINGKNTVVAYNDIGGTVTIAKAATNTTFIGNNVNDTVTVNSNDNTIMGNNITAAGNYAIDLKTSTGNNVTDNYLVASVYKGDKAVSYSNSDNIVENNEPSINIDVVADSIWVGSNGTVTVTVVNGTGNVTIIVNNKEYTAELDENGTATKVIPAEDLVVGENNVTATYESVEYAPATNATILAVLDGVITNETYKYFFDQSGNLASCVPDGATLDFQGPFLGKYPVYIDKSVNVISSTGDALFDAGATYAGNAINSFNIIAGGDNTNITGLEFINYCLYIKGASNVTVDDISIVANKRGVGSGTGFLSIHTGAYNTVVKNSYFENGGTGSSLLVLGKGGAYAYFDHNVFNITGSSGNILSANQFVGSGDAPEHVSYTNNVLYNSQPGSVFCYAMTVSGSGNLVENNTIYHNGSGILNQYGATSSGNVYRNNTLYGNTNFNPSANSIVENNKIYATTNIAANTTAVNNVFTTVAISGTNTTFANNNVTGTVTVNGNDNSINDNNIISANAYAVDLKSTTGNNVTDNYLVSNDKYGDYAVSVKDNESALIENNRPYDPEIIISVENITVGEDALINIAINENATGIANVIVGGQAYTVDMVNGFGNITIPDLVASDYTVTVSFKSDEINWGDTNSTVFNVAKLESDVNITVSGDELGNDTVIAVSIPGATGNVTVIVNGKEEEIPLDENGTATYTIDDITADDYNVVVIYPGDKTHGFAYATESFTVDKLASEVNVTAESEVKVGAETTIAVNVTEGATGIVIVNVEGIEYAINLTETKELTLAFDEAGEYTIVATYMGDDSYNAGESNTATITVSDKKAANVQVDIPDDVKVGDKIIINVTADTNAEIIVYINGEAQNFLLQGAPLGASLIDVLKYNLDKKVAYEVTHEGIYNVTVIAKENEDYTGQTVTKVFEATKNDAVLNITPITAEFGDKINITVESETDGALTIKVNGEEVTGEYEITKAGAHTITVESAATDAYNAGFATYTFNVVQYETNITVVVDGKEYNATVVNGTAVVDVDNNITVVVDGKEYNATVVNGTAVVDVDNNIIVVIDGKEYNATVVNGTATVEPVKPIATVIESEYKFTRQANDYNVGERGAMFYAVLKDINGNPLANMSCLVAVNGPIYNATTDDQGRFGVQINLAAANTYTYALSFLGNDQYGASFNCSKLILTAKKTSITAKDKTFKAKAKTKTISVTLKTVKNPYDGKTYLKAGKKITLKLNGKTYTAKTNSKGVAKFTITLTKKGKYSATVKFAGDKTYKASSKKIKVTIK